jgi:hypothetical protein
MISLFLHESVKLNNTTIQNFFCWKSDELLWLFKTFIILWISQNRRLIHSPLSPIMLNEAQIFQPIFSQIMYSPFKLNWLLYIYRMIQEGRLIFWAVILSVIVRKKVHVNMCLIVNVYRDTARDLCTRVAKCTEVDGGIFEHLLWTVTNLSFKHWIKVKIQLTISNYSFFIANHNTFVFIDSSLSASREYTVYICTKYTFYVGTLHTLYAGTNTSLWTYSGVHKIHVLRRHIT